MSRWQPKDAVIFKDLAGRNFLLTKRGSGNVWLCYEGVNDNWVTLREANEQELDRYNSKQVRSGGIYD